MLNISTASSEEIIAEAKRILMIVRSGNQLSNSTLLELINWLCAFVIRLGNDIKGIPCKTEAELEQEIAEWAKEVERFLK